MVAGGGSPRVRLDREAWQIIREATLRAAPHEACGYLGGAFDGSAGAAGAFAVGRAGDLVNESAEDRRYHFLVPADRVREAAEWLERESSDLIGFYHSHPSGGATPSEDDILRAWPGQLNLIASLTPDGDVRVCAFEIGIEDGAPHELALTLVDGRSSRLREFSPATAEVASCPE